MNRKKSSGAFLTKSIFWGSELFFISIAASSLYILLHLLLMIQGADPSPFFDALKDSGMFFDSLDAPVIAPILASVFAIFLLLKAGKQCFSKKLFWWNISFSSVCIFLLSSIFFLMLIDDEIPVFWIWAALLFASVGLSLSLIFCISKLAKILWRYIYRCFPKWSATDIHNVYGLIEKKDSWPLRLKLFDHEVSADHKKEAIVLIHEADYAKLNLDRIQQLLAFCLDEQEDERILALGSYLLENYSDLPNQVDIIRGRFQSAVRLGIFSDAEKILMSNWGQILLETIDQELLERIFFLEIELKNYHALLNFLESYQDILSPEELREKITAFLKIIYGAGEYQEAFRLLEMGQNCIPVPLFLLYLRRIALRDTSMPVYERLIELYLKWKKIPQVVRFIQAYFSVEKKWKLDYYQILKRYAKIDQPFLEMLIYSYPDIAALYIDLYALLDEVSEKQILLRKLNVLLSKTTEMSLKHQLQSLVTKIQKDLKVANSQSLKKLLASDFSVDHFGKHVSLLVELADRQGLIAVFDEYGEQIIKDPELIAFLKDLVQNEDNTFVIGDFLCDWYYTQHKFDEIYDVVKMLSRHTLEPEKYLFKKMQELNAKKPDYLPAIHVIADTYFDMKDYQGALLYYENLYQSFDPDSRYFDSVPKYLLSLYLREHYIDFENHMQAYVELQGPLTVALIEAFVKYLNKQERFAESLQFLQDTAQKYDVSHLISISHDLHDEYLKKLYLKRVEESSEDYEALYLLAKIAMKDRNWDDSFVYFQKCFKSEEYRFLAQAYGTYTLAQKDLWELSLDLFAKNPLDAPEIPAEQLGELKDTFYRTAQIFDKNRLYQQSIKYYMEIFKVDADFRDVMKKIEIFDVYRKHKDKFSS